MTTANPTSAVGVFDSAEAAENAATDLRSLGFPGSDIGVGGGVERAADAVPPSGLGTAGALFLGAGALAGYAAAWVLLFYPALGTAYIGGAAAAALAVVTGVWGVVEFARASGARWRAAPAAASARQPQPVIVTVRAGTRYVEAVVALRRHGASVSDTGPVADRAAA